MDFDDPLGESVPPRHAIESDDEDEFNPLASSKSSVLEEAKIEIIGEIPKSSGLIIASGIPGKYWARGADLGEQTGGVYVNKIQVGLIFNPSWTKSSVIISEITTRLPLDFMAPFVQAIYKQLEPSCISILDSYSIHSYISAELPSFHDAPIRYLTTDDRKLTPKAELLATPNLIVGSPAQFLNLAATRPQTPATLILLPSPQTSTPPPKTLASSDFSHISDDEVEWPTTMVRDATALLVSCVGEDSGKFQWQPKDKKEAKSISVKRDRDLGDGGMYI